MLVYNLSLSIYIYYHDAYTGTADTPLHHRSFKISTVSVQTSCKDSDGWILLQEGDSEGFIYMTLANETDAYTIQIGTNNLIYI